MFTACIFLQFNPVDINEDEYDQDRRRRVQAGRSNRDVFVWEASA